MTDSMMIGSSYAARVLLSTFRNSGDFMDRDPRASQMDYANHIDAGDGSRPGNGWLEQKWTWGRLSEHYWSHMMAYKDTLVYVYTRKNDGTYGWYTATLIVPGDEPEHYAGRVINVELVLRGLVVYTPA